MHLFKMVFIKHECWEYNLIGANENTWTFWWITVVDWINVMSHMC